MKRDEERRREFTVKISTVLLCMYLCTKNKTNQNK